MLVSADCARRGGAVRWLRKLRTFLFQPIACQQVVGFCLAIWVYAGAILKAQLDSTLYTDFIEFIAQGMVNKGRLRLLCSDAANAGCFGITFGHVELLYDHDEPQDTMTRMAGHGKSPKGWDANCCYQNLVNRKMQ